MTSKGKSLERKGRKGEAQSFAKEGKKQIPCANEKQRSQCGFLRNDKKG
jgi:hypothetical protein